MTGTVTLCHYAMVDAKSIQIRSRNGGYALLVEGEAIEARRLLPRGSPEHDVA